VSFLIWRLQWLPTIIRHNYTAKLTNCHDAMTPRNAKKIKKVGKVLMTHLLVFFPLPWRSWQLCGQFSRR
jgi:hypothetical protein